MTSMRDAVGLSLARAPIAVLRYDSDALPPLEPDADGAVTSLSPAVSCAADGVSILPLAHRLISCTTCRMSASPTSHTLPCKAEFTQDASRIELHVFGLVLPLFGPMQEILSKCAHSPIDSRPEESLQAAPLTQSRESARMTTLRATATCAASTTRHSATWRSRLQCSSIACSPRLRVLLRSFGFGFVPAVTIVVKHSRQRIDLHQDLLAFASVHWSNEILVKANRRYSSCINSSK